MWLEIGSASLGPFILELASSLSDSDKNLHLVQHKYNLYFNFFVFLVVKH